MAIKKNLIRNKKFDEKTVAYFSLWADLFRYRYNFILGINPRVANKKIGPTWRKEKRKARTKTSKQKNKHTIIISFLIF